MIIKTEAKEGAPEIAKIILGEENLNVWEKHSGTIFSLYGIKPLYFIYEGTGKIDFLEFSLSREKAFTGDE